MVLIDCVARMLPDVLGNEKSATDESIYFGLLEHPQYTAERISGMEVPEVLLTEITARISLWKFRESLILTKGKATGSVCGIRKKSGESDKKKFSKK